jgi:TRAP-type C4-dicarboxylate transport system permease small subunit
MPSLHVALAVLYPLVGFRVNRWLGVAFVLYAFLILLGSIHLGWHYAIDGYVSAIAVIAIWKLVGYFLDRESSGQTAFARR